MTTPLPQPERHWYRPPTPHAPPRPDPVEYWATYTPPAPAPRPTEPSYPWWVYAAVIAAAVLLLPLWLSVLLAWWLVKGVLTAIGAAGAIAVIPWIPWPVPDRYRNHGRWS